VRRPGIARSVLPGPPDQVRELARSLGLQLPGGVTVVDPQAVAERYVAPLAALREHRGWTEEMARDHLADPLTVGTMMLQQGEVDGLVAGAVHTTVATVRPALQILGTRAGSRLVSSGSSYACPPGGRLRRLRYQPPARRRRPGRHCYPERGVGAGLWHRTPGGHDQLQHRHLWLGRRCRQGRRATQVVREIGNTTYRAVQRSAQVVSVGPMLQGLAKPVNDLSRGALVDDIVYTVALTAIQSRAWPAFGGYPASASDGARFPGPTDSRVATSSGGWPGRSGPR
jgi:phosphate acetyltransferase